MNGGVLFVNPNAGGSAPSTDELVEAARAHGVEPRVLQPGDDLSALARAARAEVLGIAGGDGSLAPVAAAAIDRDLPLVCVPLGTRNHFARDLGLDRDNPLAALDAFGGTERRVDVGCAGERLFLNNVVLGVYARLVHRRERHRRRQETLARLRAVAILVRHPQPLRVSVDGRPLSARVIVVASNHYELQLLSLGERERLDDGLLHLYAARGVLPRTWEERTGERFRLESSAGRLRAAIDGEPVTLELPLELRVQPRALRVLVPDDGRAGRRE